MGKRTPRFWFHLTFFHEATHTSETIIHHAYALWIDHYCSDEGVEFGEKKIQKKYWHGKMQMKKKRYEMEQKKLFEVSWEEFSRINQSNHYSAESLMSIVDGKSLKITQRIHAFSVLIVDIDFYAVERDWSRTYSLDLHHQPSSCRSTVSSNVALSSVGQQFVFSCFFCFVSFFLTYSTRNLNIHEHI